MVAIRAAIALACTECSARNYRTTKARKPGSKALEIKKYCPTCNRHTVHRETK